MSRYPVVRVVRRSYDSSVVLYALFNDLLNIHHAERWSVKAYARMMACHPTALSDACVAVCGRTAKELIDARLSEAIKARLIASEDGLTVIAEDFFFTDACSFVRFFRRMEHITPGRFRRLARLKLADEVATKDGVDE